MDAASTTRPTCPPPCPASKPADQSPTIGGLAAALAKAQLQMETAKKDAQNPHLHNRYADLSSCWAACRKPLGDNGLAVAQLTESVSPGAIKIKTILLHESGEWIRSELTVPCAASKGINQAQAMGSAISYGRRYALSALVGISADDDDGSAAGSPQASQYQQPSRQAPQGPAPRQQTPGQRQTGSNEATQAQIKAIHTLCGKRKVDDVHDYASRVLKKFVGSLKEITKAEAGQIIDALNGKQNPAPQQAPQCEKAPF